ncbi:hypothetical protein KHA80_19610 [Anaerobacillus sp. HL2]|nr:hypothetical protein KHA80_19610 [Anaerobacillus sp. HL2]
MTKNGFLLKSNKLRRWLEISNGRSKQKSWGSNWTHLKIQASRKAAAKRSLQYYNFTKKGEVVRNEEEGLKAALKEH